MNDAPRGGSRLQSRPPLPGALIAPHPARLDPGRRDYARILERHAEALRAGQPFYVDPATGLQVMTAQVLWDRGACCDAGCRHCPYLARPPIP